MRDRREQTHGVPREWDLARLLRHILHLVTNSRHALLHIQRGFPELQHFAHTHRRAQGDKERERHFLTLRLRNLARHISQRAHERPHLFPWIYASVARWRLKRDFQAVERMVIDPVPFLARSDEDVAQQVDIADYRRRGYLLK